MHRILAATVAAFVLPLGMAQSPFNLPFVSNNQGATGGVIYFDLAVNTGIAILAIDGNYGQPAGTTGTVDIYTTSHSYRGQEQNASAWTLVGTAMVTTAGPDVPSPGPLGAAAVLRGGYYGIALVCSQSLNHRYATANWVSPFLSNNDLTYVLGSAQNTPFSSTVFSPRAWNGSIHYGTLTGTPAAVSYGRGCPAVQPLALTASGPPLTGTTVALVTGSIPAGTPLGATIFGFRERLLYVYHGMSLGPGMPGCLQYTPLDAALLVAVSGATTSLPIAIPALPTLAGTQVFCQSIAFSPGINPAGVITSNGLRLDL